MALTESIRPGEFLLAEANGTISREEITIAAAAAAMAAGTVLGKITKAGTASAAAYAGNTGNGVMGAITVSAGSIAGVYKLTIIEPGTNLGSFQVEDPLGIVVKTGVVGTAFSGGGLAFTLADGATDFVAGDGFNITVAAGSGKYVAYNDAAVDGSEVAAGILYGPVDDLAADQTAVAVVRHAEVIGSLLTGNNAAGTADLLALGILVR